MYSSGLKKAKKILLRGIISLSAGILIFMTSCNKNDEFSDKNTFNLDTLIINPSSGISDNFQVIWGVTTEGFPQFLIDIYLSEDNQLDGSDLKIAETADTNTSTDPTKSYIGGVDFRMTQVPGGNDILFEFSYDQNIWEGGGVTQENPAGKTRYIIGRFYHVQGLQIDTGRTMMAVEVTFK